MEKVSCCDIYVVFVCLFVLFHSGQFLGGGTGLELNGERSRIDVLSASGYTKQHGIKPHRGIGDMDRWLSPISEEEDTRDGLRASGVAAKCHSRLLHQQSNILRLHEPSLLKTTASGCSFTLWRQSWDLLLTTTHTSNLQSPHPCKLTMMFKRVARRAWPACIRVCI